MLNCFATFLLLFLPTGGRSAPLPPDPPIQQAQQHTQRNHSADQGETRSKSPDDGRAIIAEIEHGLLSGDVQSFSKYFSAQVYLSLRGGESGYFSANQAYLIVENFFSSRRTVTFKFSTVKTDDPMPYATGGGSFFERGTIHSLQVYVALAKNRDRWVITQFNVY